MKINCFRLQNFRRLKNIILDVEPDISVLVGANNSGKTSATHALDMFVNGQKDKFTVYDFSASNWATINSIGDNPAKAIEENNELPQISLDIWFDIRENDLHRVLDLLPELTWEGTVIGLRIVFQPKSSRETLVKFLEAQAKVAKHVPKEEAKKYKPWPRNLIDYLGKHLSQEYEFRYFSLDRTQFDDQFNQTEGYTPLALPLERGKPLVKSLLRIDTLHAQRYLSDQASNPRAEDLSKCLSRFYKRNLEKREDDHEALSALFDSETQLNEHLKSVFGDMLLKLGDLGYPGVSNPHLIIKSALNPSSIMSQDTKVHYSMDGTAEGLTLPDNYNGLGFKNLIYMVVELLDLQAQWIDEKEDRALLQLIIIEEPEAHLHAQLQQVFIRQILDILKISGEDASYYASQLAVTTHSPHILYERGFRPIRYFRREGVVGTDQHSVALNLSAFYKDTAEKDFFERYMKLTHCDLFFADAAILVEGNVERILLPAMIEKCTDTLRKAYVSVLEVGGAYAYRFKNLLEFLGVPALVITDLDSVKQRDNEEQAEDDEEEIELEVTEATDKEGDVPVVKKYRIGKACLPDFENAITSNQTLVKWLPKKTLIADLLACEAEDLIQAPTEGCSATMYITYQRKVSVNYEGSTSNVVGRTLEEAFALENTQWCQSDNGKHVGLKLRAKPEDIFVLAQKIHNRVKSDSFNKTSFALGVLASDPSGLGCPKIYRRGASMAE
jgi:predicted ATP-dependent endonuclease of OLD family